MEPFTSTLCLAFLSQYVWYQPRVLEIHEKVVPSPSSWKFCQWQNLSPEHCFPTPSFQTMVLVPAFLSPCSGQLPVLSPTCPGALRSGGGTCGHLSRHHDPSVSLPACPSAPAAPLPISPGQCLASQPWSGCTEWGLCTPRLSAPRWQLQHPYWWTHYHPAPKLTFDSVKALPFSFHNHTLSEVWFPQILCPSWRLLFTLIAPPCLHPFPVLWPRWNLPVETLPCPLTLLGSPAFTSLLLVLWRDPSSPVPFAPALENESHMASFEDTI